jgi:hypothetical protein
MAPPKKKVAFYSLATLLSSGSVLGGMAQGIGVVTSTRLLSVTVSSTALVLQGPNGILFTTTLPTLAPLVPG